MRSFIKLSIRRSLVFFSLILGFIFFLAGLYQNCSDVSVAPINSVILYRTFEASEINLCTAPTTQEASGTTIELLEFNIINLTTRFKNGILEPDSDMDGHIDKEDPDPLQRRTNAFHLLDSICLALGGTDQCRTALNCENIPLTSFGINACDQKALNLINDSLASSFDSDTDLIPDLLEILFRISPSNPDFSSDSDLDGSTNLEELHQGRNPLDSKKEEKKDLVLWTKERVEDPSCLAGHEAWKIKINQLPLLPVLEYSSDPSIESDQVQALSNSFFKTTNLYHNDKENVFFIYYITQTKGSSEVRRNLWGQIQILKTESHDPILLKNVTFEKIGEMILK